MPFVRICVTGDEERPTSEQKKELIAGVTKLVGDVLGKNTSNMVVIIDEIPMENYGIGGKTVRERRKEKTKLTIKRKTEPAARPIRFYTSDVFREFNLPLRLASSSGAESSWTTRLMRLRPSLGLGASSLTGMSFFVVPTSSRPAFSSIGFRSTGFSMEAASF